MTLPTTKTASRICAAAITAIATTGLVVQFVVSYHQSDSILLTLWILLAFFTITTNVLVAAVFICLAANRGALRANWIVAGTMLSILLVGVTYTLLLHGLLELSGGSVIANAILHWITPTLVPIYWIVFTPKGTLTWKHPFLWAIYPLAYFAYALLRGAVTGKYPYPFLDVIVLGWQRTTLNAIAIAIAFMLSGFAIVWIDRRTAPHPDGLDR
jgi:hypothetical protein